MDKFLLLSMVLKKETSKNYCTYDFLQKTAQCCKKDLAAQQYISLNLYFMFASITVFLGIFIGCTSTVPELPRSQNQLNKPDLEFKKVRYGTLSALLVEHKPTTNTARKGVVILTKQPLSFWPKQGKNCLYSILEPDDLGILVSASSKEDSAAAEAKHYMSLVLSKKSSQHSISVSMEPSCDAK